MTKYDFANLMLSKVKSACDEDTEVVLRKITKNNNHELDALMFTRKGYNISPVIYLDSFYNKFLYDNSTSEAVSSILTTYKASLNSGPDNVILSDNYDNVKDNILIKLVNYKKNKEQLKDMPYIPFLDMAIIFLLTFDISDSGFSSTKVTNNYKKLWGVSSKQLYKDAIKNNEKYLVPFFFSIEEVMTRMITGHKTPSDSVFRCIYDDKIINKTDDMTFRDFFLIQVNEAKENGQFPIEMYVLTNNVNINGATCILYPKLLEQVADIFETDLILIPSSIHEFIILPIRDNNDIIPNTDGLKNIVSEVNNDHVAVCDVLSDSVYYYNRDSKEVTIMK